MKSTFLDLLVHLTRAEKISRRRELYLRSRVSQRELGVRGLFLDNSWLTFVIVESQQVHHLVISNNRI